MKIFISCLGNFSEFNFFEKRKIFAQKGTAPNLHVVEKDSKEKQEPDTSDFQEKWRNSNLPKIKEILKRDDIADYEKSDLERAAKDKNLLDALSLQEQRKIRELLKKNEDITQCKRLLTEDKLDPKNAKHRALILGLPLMTLLKSLDASQRKECLPHLVLFFESPELLKKSRIPFFNYFRSEFGPDEIREFPENIRKRMGALLEVAEGWKLKSLEETIEREVTEKTAAASVVEETRDEIDGIKLQEKQERKKAKNEGRENEEAQRRMGEMLAVIQKAGFTQTVVQEAESAATEELEEAREDGAKGHERTQRMLQAIEITVRAHIEREIEKAFRGGAEALLVHAEELTQRLKRFSELREPIQNNEEGENMANFIDGTLQKIERCCVLVKKGKTEEEILAELKSGGDINEEEYKIVSAIQKAFEEMDEEALQVSSMYQEARGKFSQEVYPHVRKNRKYKKDFMFSEGGEIAANVGVSEEAIAKMIYSEQIPSPQDFTVVREFAEKHKITGDEAVKMVTQMGKAERVVSLRNNTEFVTGCLCEKNGLSPEEASQRISEARANKDSLLNTLMSASSANLQETLLAEVKRQIICMNNQAFGEIFQEEEDDVSQEELDGSAEEAESYNGTLTQIFQSDAERAKELMEKVQAISEELAPLRENGEMDPQKGLELDDAKNFLRGFSQFAEGVDITSEMARFPSEKRGPLCEIFEGITEKSKKYLSSSDVVTLQSGIRNRLQTIEEIVRSCQGKSSEEKVVILNGGHEKVSLNPDLKKIAETKAQNEKIQEERRERLRGLSRWALKNGSMEELKEFKDVRNVSGVPVFVFVNDADFEKEYGKSSEAIFLPQTGLFRIEVKASSWERGDSRIQEALRHEVLHAIDYASKNQLSKKLSAEVRKRKGGKKLLENFEKKLSREHVGWRDKLKEFIDPNGRIKAELFAHVIGNSNGLTIRGEVENFLGTDFLDSFERSIEETVGKVDWEQFRKGASLSHAATAHEEERGEGGEHVTKHAGERNFESKIAEMRRTIENIKKAIPTIRRSDVEGAKIFADTSEGALYNIEQKLENAVQTSGEGSFIEEHSEDLKKLKEQVEMGATKVAENETGREDNPLKRVWENTTFISIADIGMMWETAMSFVKRKHERKSKHRGGLVGKKLFEKAYLALADEYDSSRQEAELEEVSHHEKALKNMDGWQVMNRLHETKEKDELKACLNVLSQKGQIDWYDKRIWDALNRFSKVRFYRSDADDSNVLRTKLQKACNIYDNDYFRQLERDNGSNFESGKGKFKPEISGNINALEKMIRSMLIDKKNGGTVDPQRYEAYIERAIDDGKSSPEDIFWFLIQGVHLGILNIERIHYFDSLKLNAFPPIEYFATIKPTLSDIHELAHMFAPKDDKMEFPDHYMDWFLTHVMTDKRVQQRVAKSGSEKGKWDHDWATTIFCNGTSNTAKSILHLGTDGSASMAHTAFPNMLVGQLAYITNLARNGGELASDFLETDLKRQLGMMAMYNTLVSSKVETGGERFYTLNKHELDNPPRIDTSYVYLSKKRITARELIHKNFDIIKALDPIFGEIFEGYISDKRATDVLVPKIKKRFPGVFDDVGEPRTALDFLMKLDNVIAAAIKDPKSRKRMMEKAVEIYKEDHDGEDNIDKVRYAQAKDWEEHFHDEAGKSAHSTVEYHGMYAAAH
ncbi:hypothetical protein HZA38_05535 [Candidatus Peregrinibacteria bacterium]|nr:hypothetical protein [Candidatus Peregrinibacteria bacterium]